MNQDWNPGCQLASGCPCHPAVRAGQASVGAGSGYVRLLDPGRDEWWESECGMWRRQKRAGAPEKQLRAQAAGLLWRWGEGRVPSEPSSCWAFLSLTFSPASLSSQTLRQCFSHVIEFCNHAAWSSAEDSGRNGETVRALDSCQTFCTQSGRLQEEGHITQWQWQCIFVETSKNPNWKILETYPMKISRY